MKSIQQFKAQIGRHLYCTWTHPVNSLIHQSTVINGNILRPTNVVFTFAVSNDKESTNIGPADEK